MIGADLWILDTARNPRPAASVVEWGAFLENGDARRVACTTIGACEVSTVFIGIDFSFGRRRRPLLFETMIFGEGEGDRVVGRTATWAEAHAMHNAAVAELEAARERGPV